MSTVVGPPRPGPTGPAPPTGRHPVPLVPVAVLRHLPLVSVLTAAWVLGWGLIVEHTDRPPAPFHHIDHWIASSGPTWTRVANQIANLGDGRRMAVIALVVIVVCAIGRSWRALLAAVVSLVGVLLLVEVILKPLVDARLDPASNPAYPSGHTATAAVLGTMAILLLCRAAGPLRFTLPRPVRAGLAVVAVAAGPIVGLAMVTVGAHSVVDVLGALPLAPVLTLWLAALVDRSCGASPPRTRPETI